MESLSRKATIYIADLSSSKSISALVPEILKDGFRTDVLLNYTTETSESSISNRCLESSLHPVSWSFALTKFVLQVLQVNLTSIFTMCRDVGAHMLQQTPDASGRRGSIINVASLLSFQGGVTVPAYAASKGGVAQVTKALSNEWARNVVAANAMAPGYIATEMNAALVEDDQRAKNILARILTI